MAGDGIHKNHGARAAAYIRRALKLRCPECGQGAVFIPWRKVRKMDDWLHPRERCEHCGILFDRENGYFLLAIWGFNYGIVGLAGIIITVVVNAYYPLSMGQDVVFIFLPLALLNVVMVRHAKSLYMAMDRFFDPEVR